MPDLLQRIQELQFSNKAKAEQLLQGFIAETFGFEVTACELRPQATSLNSFNGFITLGDGTRKFFKTHTERDTVIDEYYNAGLLADAGYPVIRPTHRSTQAGQHILIYDVIESPSVFDVAWAIERGEDTTSYEALEQAQAAADDALLAAYKETLAHQNSEEAAEAPIHQLFYHRLVGGRLQRFYGPAGRNPQKQRYVMLPDGPATMEEVRSVYWSINSQTYSKTINDIIEHAVHLLRPTQDGISVIGHGDAHNGNVFFMNEDEEPRLVYFDPAFAGRHDPLLDLAKPLFHNVFAMWMYYPYEKRDDLVIRLARDGDRWMVGYEYPLPEVRQMFLRSKLERVMIPLVRLLKEQGNLRPDWRPYFKAALFACPFLTLDLADNSRFPPEISLLGLVMSVEMGAEGTNGRSLIDTVLDGVERAI